MAANAFICGCPTVTESETELIPSPPWRWPKDHLIGLLNLLETGLESDVTFQVGPHEEDIKAHRLILIAGPPKLAEKVKSSCQEIQIPNVKPKIFTMFLKHIYGGRSGVGILSALPLLQVAKEYEVTDLIELCEHVLRTKLTDDDMIIFAIFEQSIEFCHHGLKYSTLEYICRNGVRMTNSCRFLTLRPECLIEILKQDALSVRSELELFERVIKWGEAECTRLGLNPFEINDLRQSLSSVLIYIRFPNFKPMELLQVSNKSILEEKELVSLLPWFVSFAPSDRSMTDDLPDVNFPLNPRDYIGTAPNCDRVFNLDLFSKNGRCTDLICVGLNKELKGQCQQTAAAVNANPNQSKMTRVAALSQPYYPPPPTYAPSKSESVAPWNQVQNACQPLQYSQSVSPPPPPFASLFPYQIRNQNFQNENSYEMVIEPRSNGQNSGQPPSFTPWPIVSSSAPLECECPKKTEYPKPKPPASDLTATASKILMKM